MNGENDSAESPDQDEPNESSYILRHKRFSCQEHMTSIRDDDWGWYVVGGCAFANFLLPGMLRSFGSDVLDEFTEIHEFEFKNRFYFLWIPATFNLTFFIAGSLSCLLCELTSHRTVTFWGGLLASIGMMASSFTYSIPYLFISYGIMVGFGAGLCYPAGILIVNEYFHENRGLANGFSLVGTTIGSFALPSYIQFLTSSYGFRGGILIVSGMLLNLLACALTYKPVNKHTEQISSTTIINIRIESSTVVKVKNDCSTSVASSPLLEPLVTTTVEEDGPKDHVHTVRRRLFGDKSATELLAVSAVNVVSHLAYAAFSATTSPPMPSNTAPLQMAAADAAGRLLVPTVSDLLSSGGSASICLNAVAMTVGGVVLLAAAAAAHTDLSQRQPFSQSSTSTCLLFVTFGLASGAAIGLEPLVAVHILGRERLPVSYSVTLLGKGVAQLAVDLLFFASAGRHSEQQQQQISTHVVLYVLGSCLMSTAVVWTVVFLFKCHYTLKYGCSRYVRTV